MIMIVLLCGVVFAEDDAVASVDEEELEALPTVTYLDDLVRGTGSITAVLKLSDEGEESPFFSRYNDPFEQDWFYIDNLNYRELTPNGEYFRFNLRETGDPSYWASLMWTDLGNASVWANDYKYEYYDMPSGYPATWRSGGLGFQAVGPDAIMYGFNINFTDSLKHDPGPGLPLSYWEATAADFDLSWKWGTWSWDVDVNVTDYTDVLNDSNDTGHAVGTARIGRKFGEDTYLEGRLGYADSDVYGGENLTMTTYGIFGCFMNPLGIDKLNVIAELDWTDISEDGPAVLHPQGNSFDFDLEGRWRVSPRLWLNGAWSYQENDVTHSDQFTNYYHYFNPGQNLLIPTYITETVGTNATELGGKYEINDEMDFSFDLAWVDRDSLPMTDLVYWDSATLWWDSENTYDFALSYNQGLGRFLENGNWALKYRMHERENGARQSVTSDDHFTLNYSGMLNDAIWVYAGYGYLTTENTIFGELDESLDGTEYGGGLAWDLNETWDFYGDFWMYNTDDPWGFDQTSYTAGLGYNCDADWEFNLEYYNEDGEFDLAPRYDYNVEQLKLFLTYLW